MNRFARPCSVQVVAYRRPGLAVRARGPLVPLLGLLRLAPPLGCASDRKSGPAGRGTITGPVAIGADGNDGHPWKQGN